MYLAFTRMPVESYRTRLRSLLLCLCDVFERLLTPLFVDFALALWASFCFRSINEQA